MNYVADLHRQAVEMKSAGALRAIAAAGALGSGVVALQDILDGRVGPALQRQAANLISEARHCIRASERTDRHMAVGRAESAVEARLRLPAGTLQLRERCAAK